MPAPTVTEPALRASAALRGSDRTEESPPKWRRRPSRTLAAVAVVLVGALAGAWAWTSTTATVDVVAARTTLLRGEVIDRADLIAVRVGVDPALHPVRASEIDTLVGKRAALDIAAGGFVTTDAVSDGLLPARGYSVVGLSVGAGLVPSGPLEPGDQVRIVTTPGQQADVDGVPGTVGATVVRVTSADNGEALVDVQVPESAAAELAARAATGRVAVVLDSRER
ncbi:MAG: hypothetical protein IPO80_04670 [Propionibacteriaceae bacterium]|nr:hypothetical protein [Propionibacteriaceae bacterium]